MNRGRLSRATKCRDTSVHVMHTECAQGNCRNSQRPATHQTVDTNTVRKSVQVQHVPFSAVLNLPYFMTLDYFIWKDK